MPTFTALSRVSCSRFPEHITSWHEAEISLAGGQQEFRRAERGQKARSIHDKKMQMHEAEQKGTWSAAVSTRSEPWGRAGCLDCAAAGISQGWSHVWWREGSSRAGEEWSDNSPCNSHLPQPVYIQFKRDATKTQHQLRDFWEAAGENEKLLSVTLRNWRKGSWFLVQEHLSGTSLLNLFTQPSITSILHRSLRGKKCSLWLKIFWF